MNYLLLVMTIQAVLNKHFPDLAKTFAMCGDEGDDDEAFACQWDEGTPTGRSILLVPYINANHTHSVSILVDWPEMEVCEDMGSVPIADIVAPHSLKWLAEELYYTLE